MCWMHIAPQDMLGLMKGLELFKPYFTSSLFQIASHIICGKHHQFKAYNKKNNRWEISIEKYIKKIEQLSV